MLTSPGIAAVPLLLTALAAAAQHPTVSTPTPDPAEPLRLIITATNRSQRPITVCITNQLAISADNHNAGFAPFYVEKQTRGAWHVVIGSDIATRFTYRMKPGESDPFTIEMPPAGTYRIAMNYTQSPTDDCTKFIDLHPHTVYSPPFTSTRTMEEGPAEAGPSLKRRPQAGSH